MGSVARTKEDRKRGMRVKGEGGSGFGADAAKKMMWGRGETPPQGVANLMTVDWLCIEHGWVGVR